MSLSDGRQLFFFDETQGLAADRRTAVDRRGLPPAEPFSQLRRDIVRDEWVTVAGHRQARTHLPPHDECPLCPSREGYDSEIPAADYDVVVFENRFPSFVAGSAGRVPPSDDGLPGGEPLFRGRPGVGRCEVVAFTSAHDAAFSSLTPRRVRTVIEAWADRTAELSARDDVEQVFCFENRGEEIGVTLGHPHGQIYGYPYVTPHTARGLRTAAAYRERTGRSVFADVLLAETQHGGRVVVSGEHWTAFVPYAARWPMEVHLYPHRQLPDLPALDEAERGELAEVYLDVLRRMESVHDDTLPYIAAWHQAPVRQARDLAYLHLELFSMRRSPGRLKHLAGSESAMGAFVNDVSPESTAEALRQAGCP
jgi:UDPglucose--hexose-1-phosphate uridylyltransferase